MNSPHILDLEFEELKKKLPSAFRAQQIADWIFTKGAETFDEMTNLPQDLRSSLKRDFALRKTTLAKTELSKRDGTLKLILQTQEGQQYPCVFLPHGHYQSLCISTQVGCAWECSFCASGLVKFERNLTPGEILEQILYAEKTTGKKIRNILFMGMGEPLANYAGTVGTIRWLTSLHGMGFQPSRIVLSTTGLAPQILKLSKENLRVNLALSLHAPDDILRKKIMPKSSKFPIKDVLAACKTYWQENGGEFTIEYILLKDINDQPAHAEALANLLTSARFPALPKINLIPQNPVGGIALGPSTESRAKNFFDLLKKRHFIVHTRKPQGQDLEAACGQLQ